MIYISPSVLAADFLHLGDEVESVERAGADFLHLDIMDGVFVPNISFGPDVVSALRQKSSLILDTHLMISNPDKYIETFAKAGADIITIHYESVKDTKKTLEKIKSLGCKASLSIKPKTLASEIFHLLEFLDMVLVMTVEPGFGGQKMMESTLRKVYELRVEANRRSLKLNIEVDGGITPQNAGKAAAYGANVLVAGSSIFKAQDRAHAISEIRKEAEKNYFTLAGTQADTY